MKTIILLTDYKNRIPQREKEIVGLKTDILSKILIENGFDVIVLNIFNVIRYLKEKNLKNVYVYYASSQYPIYKSYIQDIIIQIDLRGGILVPEFHHFVAHENKTFQELEKERKGIPSPSSTPICTYESGIDSFDKLTFPVVLKKSSGFGSRTVKIAHNKKEAKRILVKMLEKNFKFDFESLIYLYRRLRNKNQYPRKFGKVIIQEFIPGLDSDWKILVLGQTSFCLKRYVKKNDFRASGSGIFSTSEDPSSDILNFAIECKEKLRCPNISLDIVVKGKSPVLIEYQTNHFGLLTAMKAEYYFELENNTWKKKKKTHEPEYYMALGICEYIENMKNTEV